MPSCTEIYSNHKFLGILQRRARELVYFLLSVSGIHHRVVSKQSLKKISLKICRNNTILFLLILCSF